MPDSYKSNIAKALKRTFYSNYMLIGKKRLIQRQELEQKDVWSQEYQDKYHEKNGVGKIGMDICRNASTKNDGCQVWFVLRTS